MQKIAAEQTRGALLPYLAHTWRASGADDC